MVEELDQQLMKFDYGRHCLCLELRDCTATDVLRTDGEAVACRARAGQILRLFGTDDPEVVYDRHLVWPWRPR
jgi:hypothetical protein